MNCKRIVKDYRKLISSPFSKGNYPNGLKRGVIFTLYSDKHNLLELGFADNNTVLENKILFKEFILIDKKKGTKRELYLLIDTLQELGIKNSSNLNFKYSNQLIRHLSILGWPIGKSIYKQRRIKKELACA